MRRFRWFHLLPVLSLLAAGLASGQETPAPASGRHSLWRVQGTSNVVYLLGAVHLLKPSHYPLAAPIEAAFSNADIAVFEADLDEMESPATQGKMLTKSRLPAGETLKQVLSPDTYAGFEKRVTDAGLPGAVFETFKPAMAGITLVVLELQKMGVDPEYGVDRHFFQLARETHKTVVPLETVDFQIDLVTDLTKDEGELMMKSVLTEIDNTRKFYKDMVIAWQTGDAPKLETLLNEAMREAPSIYKRMVTDRTRRWVPKVEELLAGSRNAIVIVGAGHLVGKDGLVELLQAKGRKVSQL